MTTTTSSPEKEIECCPVCYEGFEEQLQEEDDENADENADVEMGTLPIGSGRIELECNHVFCRNCLLEYCRHNIQMKRIPIPCPTIGNISKHKHDKFADCEQVLQNHLVEDILLQSSSSTTKARRGTPDDHDDDNDDNDDKDKDAQHLIKFRRFQQMAQDPTLLPCPKCDELVSQVRQQMKDQEQAKQHGHGLVASSSENKEKDNKDNLKENINNKDKVSNDNDARLSCHSCYHTFCAVHGDAHPGIPCSDYARSREARQIRQSEKSLEQWTKSCSHVHCGARIHKAEGCDHVVCPACHKDMCFKCGTHLHLTGKVIRSCAKCQQGFVDHRYTRQYRLRQCIWLPFMLPGMLFYVAFMGLVAVLTLGFGCCFRCGLDVDNENDDNSSNDPHDHPRRKVYAPCRGIQRGATIVFLPLVQILRDFGFPYCSDIDDMWNEDNELKEIPTLSIDDGNDNNDGEA